MNMFIAERVDGLIQFIANNVEDVTKSEVVGLKCMELLSLLTEDYELEEIKNVGKVAAILGLYMDRDMPTFDRNMTLFKVATVLGIAADSLTTIPKVEEQEVPEEQEEDNISHNGIIAMATHIGTGAVLTTPYVLDLLADSYSDINEAMLENCDGEYVDNTDMVVGTFYVRAAAVEEIVDQFADVDFIVEALDGVTCPAAALVINVVNGVIRNATLLKLYEIRNTELLYKI